MFHNFHLEKYVIYVNIFQGVRLELEKNPKDLVMSRINKYGTEIVSRDEIGNFLDNFETNILWSLSEQLDTVKI